MDDLATVVFHTLLWASLSTVVVLCFGVAFAYILARFEFPGKLVLSTLLSLPLVLPPTAVGYLLLRLLSDKGLLGRDTLGFDLGFLFNWKGVVLACSVMSLPLVVRTARVSFESVDRRLVAMSQTLGYNSIRAFACITLPLAFRGLAAAAILGFTRAMGEFGATLIVAGNIPGRTQTLASALYSAQQAGDESRATILLGVALGVGFFAILVAEWLTRPQALERRSRL